MITNLEPEYYGYRYCLIAINCFNKWVEIVPLRDKLSTTLAEWLYRELILRFRKPSWLRCYSSHKFMGGFKTLCFDLGKTLHIVSNYCFKANGQIEKVNREIKRAIRRYALLNPNSSWFNWLLEIFIGLCWLCRAIIGIDHFFKLISRYYFCLAVHQTGNGCFLYHLILCCWIN